MTPAPTKRSPSKIPPSSRPVLFRQLLEKRGIVIYGHQRTRHTELATLSTFSVTALAPSRGGSDSVARRPLKTDHPITLASYESKPLLARCSRHQQSQPEPARRNSAAPAGRERGNAGTIEGGLEVLRGFLTQAGISNDQYPVLRRLRTLAPEPGHTARDRRSCCAMPRRNRGAPHYKSTFPVSGSRRFALRPPQRSAPAKPHPGQDRLAGRRENALRIRHHRRRTGGRLLDPLQQFQSPREASDGRDRPGSASDRGRRDRGTLARVRGHSCPRPLI